MYTPSEGKFEGTSTSAADYRKWAISRPIQIDKERLSGTKKYQGGSAQAFEGETIHRNSYKAWKTNKIELVKPPAPSNSAAPLGARFEGTSTQRKDFVPLAIPNVRLSFRPNLMYNPAKEDRDFVSQTSAAHNVKPLSYPDMED